MKQVRGIWIPEDEQYLIRFLETSAEVAGAGVYQFRKYAAALPQIKTFRNAVDVGAHVGLWSRLMALYFRKVIAFEPIEEAAACFRVNVKSERCDVVLEPVALGKKAGNGAMEFDPTSTLMTRLKKGASRQVDVRTLDSYGLQKIDFIKIDVEGYERDVLLGGEKTIQKWKPCIVIEQKKNKKALLLLKEWGAQCKWEIDGDYCYTWKKQ